MASFLIDRFMFDWQVQDPMAINLLFHEAYHNYIRSLYPCADQDAVIMAGILMQLNQGDYDQRKTKTFFQSWVFLIYDHLLYTTSAKKQLQKNSSSRDYHLQLTVTCSIRLVQNKNHS